MTETTHDALLGGRILLEQPAGGLRAAIDAVLLAAAVPARAGDAVLELGCGAGPVFLCLAARVPGITVHGVERDAALAELARRNAARAGIAAHIEARDLRAGGAPRVAHSAANPPYWPGGTASPRPGRRDAAHESGATLADWVRALAAPLAHKGTASLVLPAARFADAARALRDAGCGAVALLPLWPRAGVAAKRVIIRAVKGGRGPDRVLPGLVLHEADGAFTAAAQAVLRDGAAL